MKPEFDDDEFGFKGESFLEPDFDDDGSEGYSREDSVISHGGGSMSLHHLPQFDQALFPEREHDQMDFSDPNMVGPTGGQHYLGTRQMMHHELLGYHQQHAHQFHDARENYHSAAASLNSSARASPDASSYAESDYLDGTSLLNCLVVLFAQQILFFVLFLRSPDFSDNFSEPDSFSFDSLREKVEHGLTLRHDQRWLAGKNILKREFSVCFWFFFLHGFDSPISCHCS